MDIQFVTMLILGLVSFSNANCPICGGAYPWLDEQLRTARDLAVYWLADQQNVDGSWPNVNTQNAILGLQLADRSWLATQDLGKRLLTKSRLEYELMQYLLSWKSKCRLPLRDFELGGGRLGQYILALAASCIPVTDFYGNNLESFMVRLLKKFPQEDFNNFFQYSLAILSLCSSEADISRKALARLAKGSDSSNPCYSQFGIDGHSIDILSMQVMAMVCARDQAINKNVRNWDSILSARVQCILDGQNVYDGSFGNAITTALAIQALTAADVSPESWACVDAVQFILNKQHTEGDFGGVGSTAQIIPALGCNNFGSLRDITVICPSLTASPIPPPIQRDDNTTTFQVKVVVYNQTETYSVTILSGENLYYGMIRLADINNDFTFVTSDSAFGQSIDAINGVADDATNSLYWTIHIGQEGTYAPRGIEGLFPSEGEAYLFILTDFS